MDKTLLKRGIWTLVRTERGTLWVIPEGGRKTMSQGCTHYGEGRMGYDNPGFVPKFFKNAISKRMAKLEKEKTT